MYFSTFVKAIVRSFAMVRSNIWVVVCGSLISIAGIGVYELNLGFIALAIILYPRLKGNIVEFMGLMLLLGVLGAFSIAFVILHVHAQRVEHRKLLYPWKIIMTRFIPVFLLYQISFYIAAVICFLPSLVSLTGGIFLYPQYSPIATSIATVIILCIALLQMIFVVCAHAILLETAPSSKGRSMAYSTTRSIVNNHLTFLLGAWISITLCTIFVFLFLLILLHMIIISFGTIVSWVLIGVAICIYSIFFSLKNVYWSEILFSKGFLMAQESQRVDFIDKEED